MKFKKSSTVVQSYVFPISNINPNIASHMSKLLVTLMENSFRDLKDQSLKINPQLVAQWILKLNAYTLVLCLDWRGAWALRGDTQTYSELWRCRAVWMCEWCCHMSGKMKSNEVKWGKRALLYDFVMKSDYFWSLINNYLRQNTVFVEVLSDLFSHVQRLIP